MKSSEMRVAGGGSLTSRLWTFLRGFGGVLKAYLECFFTGLSLWVVPYLQ